MENSDYSKKDILIALRNAGLVKGDDILVHSNLGFFGKLDGNNESVDYCQAFAEAIFDVIGNEGTLIVPTFTYSFCWNKIFDLEKTATSDCGIFSEYIRNLKDAKRSFNPFWSLTAIGPLAEKIVDNVSNHAYDKNSSFSKLFKIKNSFFLSIGQHPRFMLSIIHHFEHIYKVPYRFTKDFKIDCVKNSKITTPNHQGCNDYFTLPRKHKRNRTFI